MLGIEKEAWMRMRKIQLNGCIPSPRDDRDYRLVCAAGASPPRQADLRSLCSAVEHQSSLNSCTANAAVGAMEILERKQQIEQLDLSRLFVYWNTRAIDGTTDQDPGAYIRSSMKAVETKGACLESIWPYAIDRVLTKPSDASYVDGEKRQALEYLRVAQGVGVRQAIADGFPVVFGMLLSESFMNARFGGNVPMPRTGEEIVGGHAMLIVGYDMDAQTYIVRNSWGEHWGDKGYCYIPFALVDDPSTSFDFWIIRLMEVPIDGSQILRPGKEEKIRGLKRLISRLKRRIRRTPRRMRGRRARMLREIRRLRRRLRRLERKPAG